MSTKISYNEMSESEAQAYNEACEIFQDETVGEMSWSESQGAYLSPRLAQMEGQLFHGIGDPDEFRAAIDAARAAYEAGDAAEYYDGDAYAEDRDSAGQEAVREYRRSH